MEVFDVEKLAQILHEAGREAVNKGLVLNKRTDLGFERPTFVEWEDLPEEAREGRRSQARYLLLSFKLTPLLSGEMGA